jgi:hypothetical protein
MVLNNAESFFTPHARMYYNTSIDALKPDQRASVVRPLFDHSNEFDIAVTVWLRTEGMHGDDALEAAGEREGIKLTEKPLFSDIVFHGVGFTDKNVFANVNFTVPTAIL